MKDKKQTLMIVLTSAIVALIVTVIFNGVASMTGFASISSTGECVPAGETVQCQTAESRAEMEKRMEAIEKAVEEAVKKIREIAEKVSKMQAMLEQLQSPSMVDRLQWEEPEGTSTIEPTIEIQK